MLVDAGALVVVARPPLRGNVVNYYIYLLGLLKSQNYYFIPPKIGFFGSTNLAKGVFKP